MAALLASAACGDVKPNQLPDAPPAPDGATIDAAPADAPPPRCDPAKPFGAPVAFGQINTPAQEAFAWLTGDELTLLFSSTRAGGLGGWDIYIATRTTATEMFGAPALLAGVNTAGNERRPVMTADGLALYADTQVNPNSAVQISRATRASTAAAFGALSPIGGINTADSSAPFVVPDGSALYFSSNRVATSGYNLYLATGAAGSFGTPALVSGTNLATASAEDVPVLTPDQLTLYFVSDRAGGSGEDIWRATRANLAAGFGAPALVTELNTTANDVPTWVSSDGCLILFYREDGIAASNLNVYRAAKPL